MRTDGGGRPVPLYMANSDSRELHLLVRRVSRLTASERSEALSDLGLLSMVLSRSSCVEMRLRRRTSTALCESLRIALGDNSSSRPLAGCPNPSSDVGMALWLYGRAKEGAGPLGIPEGPPRSESIGEKEYGRSAPGVIGDCSVGGTPPAKGGMPYGNCEPMGPTGGGSDSCSRTMVKNGTLCEYGV